MRGLRHLEVPGKVFWSRERLSVQELNSLVSGALANLALYRNSGLNIELMGMSSGKLCRSVAAGSPVIASKFESLRFVEEHGLGVLVERPEEIAQAVHTLYKGREEYRKNCQRAGSTIFSLDAYWSDICRVLMKASGVDLGKKTRIAG